MELTQNTPAITGEQVAGRAATVRAELSRMVGSVQRQTLDLAELLVEALENGYPQQWGFVSTLDYAQRELGLKKRKSEYLIRVVTVCKEVGVPRTAYESVGTTKLREITRLNPKDTFYNKDTKEHEDIAAHIVHLIAAAPNLTFEEVEAEVARLKGQTGEDRQVLRNFKITQSCWDNVFVPALEKVRRMLGSAGRDAEGAGVDYSLGVCLEAILADFNAAAGDEPEVNPPVITTPGEVLCYTNIEGADQNVAN